MKPIYYTILISFLILFQIKAQAQWSELGGTNSLSLNEVVKTLCNDKFGNIYAAGSFTDSLLSSKGHQYVVKWNGTVWAKLEGTNTLGANSTIQSICSDPAGNIYAAGFFSNINGKHYVAKWDGNSWSELGGINGLYNIAVNFYDGIYSICSDKAGNIYASINHGIAKWDGTTWSYLGGLDPLLASSNIRSICIDRSGNIYVSGLFSYSGQYFPVVKWDHTLNSWSKLPNVSGFTSNFNLAWAMCSDTSGNIYIGGDFNNSSSNKYVAKWDGTNWSELGGLNGLAANYAIFTMVCDKSGNVYASGGFTNGTNNSNGNVYVAKFNGTTWGELGGLNSIAIYLGDAGTILADSSGNIYAAGSLRNSNSKYMVIKYGNVSGLNTIDSKAALNLFPNPANNTVYIQFDKAVVNATIRLINIAGQKVLEKQNLSGNHFELDIANQQQGIYLIEIQQQDNIFRGKIMKE